MTPCIRARKTSIPGYIERYDPTLRENPPRARDGSTRSRPPAAKPNCICMRGTPKSNRVFLESLTAGTLNFFDLASLAKPAAFPAQLVAMRRISWVVYAKRPFGGDAQLLAYFGGYPIACNRQQPARSPRR
ncbi:hypothetical protein ACFQX9_14665 [Bradyrhizobium sp. GCM10028915]|uniref:hypothetical protein n=1 Tax=Bradyrhizobium sp. GCM10028915 TaxID=3273385 RepID=UPI0036216FE9